MSTELIVLRAFVADQALAEEMLARGFAPDLMTTREGRKVAETLLALRKDSRTLSLENLQRALAHRGRLGGGFKRYLVGLERTPCLSRLHAVAHLQMLKLDLAMARVDNVCQRSLACAGLAGERQKAANEEGVLQLEEPRPETPSGARGESGPGDGRALR